MSDLISRQAAIDAVDEALTRVFVEHRDIAEKMINKIPSADLSEYSDKLWKTAYEHGKRDAHPQKGKWIVQITGWGDMYYECSYCKGAITLIDGTPEDNFYCYCPHCGVRMEES